MHITPGLIDAHSHTGLFRFGVNESGMGVPASLDSGFSVDLPTSSGIGSFWRSQFTASSRAFCLDASFL